MELSDIYLNHVKNSQVSGRACLSLPSGSPVFQRDPNLIKMESDVFSQLSDIVNKNSEANPSVTTAQNKAFAEVAFVSFEDALAQLLKGELN